MQMPEAIYATFEYASKIKKWVMSAGVVAVCADSGEELKILRQKFRVKINLISTQATTACEIEDSQDHANFVRARMPVVCSYFERRKFSGVGVNAHDQYLAFS